MGNKHGFFTWLCPKFYTYSWAPPRPTSGVTKHKASRAKYRQNLSFPCPCLFIPHDTLPTEQTEVNGNTRRSTHRKERDDAPTIQQAAKQRTATRHKTIPRTHHDATHYHTTPHDNPKHRVPRHNTHPNTAQHHSKQNTTQGTTTPQQAHNDNTTGEPCNIAQRTTTRRRYRTQQ